MTTADSNKPTYLYRCYDQFGALLYVGITDNPERRMRAHAAEKFWWGDVVKTTNMAFRTREQALWAEWAVITTCHPLHNVAASVPAEHRCPPPPPPPLAIDGYISIVKALKKIQKNADKYTAMHQEMDALFAEAGVAPAGSLAHHDPARIVQDVQNVLSCRPNPDR